MDCLSGDLRGGLMGESEGRTNEGGKSKMRCNYQVLGTIASKNRLGSRTVPASLRGDFCGDGTFFFCRPAGFFFGDFLSTDVSFVFSFLEGL